MRLRLMLSIVAFILSNALFAQRKLSGIEGFVKDSATTKTMIDAVVTISSSEMEGQKIAVTNTKGFYKFIKLQPGTYTVTFEMEGYKKHTQENIQLTPRVLQRLNVKLIRGNETNDKVVRPQFKKNQLVF